MSNPQFETRVYIRQQCFLSRISDKPKGEIFGALAAIFVPLLIEKALGGVAAAFKKAGADETLKESGRLPTYLYRLTRNGKAGADAKNILGLNSDLSCLLVVRGTFSSPDDIPPPATKYGSEVLLDDSEESEDQRIKLLNDNGIPVKQIALLYEAEISFAQDQTALRYTSRYLQVKAFQGGKSHDERVMAITLAVTGAGEKEGEPVLSLVSLNLGEISRNTILGPAELRSKRSGWVGGLGISSASAEALKTIDFPPEPKPPDDRKFLQIMPVTIEVVIAETDEGSKILKFIGEVLDSTKGEVSKAVSSEILKDPAKAKEAAADALEKLRGEEETAYTTLLDAKVSLAKLATDAKPEERAVAQFKIDAAKRAWCAKFKALNTLGIALTRADTCP